MAVYEKEPDAVVNTVEGMRADFKAGTYEFFVAEEKGNVVGFALYFKRYSTWTGTCLFLEDLYVQEEHRKRGLGKELFFAVARAARSMNVARLQWQCLDWNPAMNFYRRLGAVVESTWLNLKLTREQLQQMQQLN